MLSNDVVATSRYHLNQLQHILSDLRNFDSFGFLAIFEYETYRGFCVELVSDIFIDQYHHCRFRLSCSCHLVTKGQNLVISPTPTSKRSLLIFPK